MNQEWNVEHAANFRVFQTTPTGKLLFELHKASRPKVTAKSFEEVALEAKIITGYEASEDFFAEKANFNEQPPRAPAFIEGMERD